MDSSARCVSPPAHSILAVPTSPPCSQPPELLLLLQHHLFPLLFRLLPERSAFPLMFRGTRVVFLLLKQFSAELATEAEAFHKWLVKLASGEAGTAETMRVCVGAAIEIRRGCVFLLLSLSLIVWRLYTHTHARCAGTLNSCVASRNAVMP
jgi:hypothetical protein